MSASRCADDDLRAILGGAIVEVSRARHNGFAFVRFENEADAAQALERNGYKLADGWCL